MAGTGREPERLAHVGLDRGIDVGVGADRARELADGDARPGPGQPLAVAVHLHGPERELGPERGGLGVDAVGAPGHGDRAVGVGLGGDRHLEGGGGLEHEVDGLHQHHRERGVDDVARREAVVEPGAGRGADALLDHVDEGGDVVLGGASPARGWPRR